MKYTITISTPVTRYIIGQLIKSFKDICPRGVKAIWAEDKSKGDSKHKTGKIDIVTKFSNMEKACYDAKKDIEAKLNELVQKAEAEKQVWYEEQQKKRAEERKAKYEANKAEEKAAAEEAKKRRGTFAEAFDNVATKMSEGGSLTSRSGKWPKKEKVAIVPPAVTPMFQPKGAWAMGRPITATRPSTPPLVDPRKMPQTLPEWNVKLAQIDTSFTPVSNNWTDEPWESEDDESYDEWAEEQEYIAQRMEAQIEYGDPWDEGSDVYAAFA